MRPRELIDDFNILKGEHEANGSHLLAIDVRAFPIRSVMDQPFSVGACYSTGVAERATHGTLLTPVTVAL